MYPCCFKTHLGSWGWPWTPDALVSTSESGVIVGMHSHIGFYDFLWSMCYPCSSKIWHDVGILSQYMIIFSGNAMTIKGSGQTSNRPCVFCFLMLEMEPRASGMQSKHSTNWILPPTRVLDLVMKTCIRHWLLLQYSHCVCICSYLHTVTVYSCKFTHLEIFNRCHTSSVTGSVIK